MIMNKLKVIDIGHTNLSIDTAMLDLETKISQLNFEGDYKVVKVIFGHGSGALKQTIKGWIKAIQNISQDLLERIVKYFMRDILMRTNKKIS